MQDLRTYGGKPFSVAVVHGGPGAAGEMAPVARALAGEWGVLEPLQTATSVTGQIEELRTVLEDHADLPVTLIGYSWGAWLSTLCAAYHPALVKQLILVSSGPFEEKYAADIQMTRLGRLDDDERREIHAMTEAMKDPAVRDKDALLARFGTLFAKADACDPTTLGGGELKVCWDIHTRVWKEAAQLRSSGKLLALAKRIECPVQAVHGDCDPHPAEGVRKPLTAALEDFQFTLLQHCGHKPWIERRAADAFYALLKQALR
jgi:pimeloyl-ACP methyl ester carboxylesterase